MDIFQLIISKESCNFSIFLLNMKDIMASLSSRPSLSTNQVASIVCNKKHVIFFYIREQDRLSHDCILKPTLLLSAIFPTQFNLKEDRLAGGDDQEILADHFHLWVQELNLNQNIVTLLKNFTTHKHCCEESGSKLLWNGQLVEIRRGKMEPCSLKDKLEEMGTLEFVLLMLISFQDFLQLTFGNPNTLL